MTNNENYLIPQIHPEQHKNDVTKDKEIYREKTEGSELFLSKLEAHKLEM